MPVNYETLVDVPKEILIITFCALFTISETEFSILVVHFLLKNNQGTDLILLKIFKVRYRKPRLTALEIRCADHATPSTSKSWH
jgi:hypothetical protein